FGSNQQAMRVHPTLVFLVMNATGYDNLTRLASLAHMEGAKHSRAHVTVEQVAELSDGLIALTGGPDGPLNSPLRDGQNDLAQARAARLKDIFGDRLYIELQRHTGHPPAVEAALLDLAYGKDIAIVATNEAYFGAADAYDAHDALLCIAAGRKVFEEDRRKLTPDHRLKSAAEMHALFADLPEAIENTLVIAERCAFAVQERDPILPFFTGGKGDDPLEAEAEELRVQARKGLEARLSVHPLADGFSREDYDARLERELDIIIGMKFPGYFLIVADFIKWAKDQGIPVGPGRGSGAGSLVAWALTVTDLDPLRFALLFERFLNPERISMPDFDIDFCQDRRDEVIQYVQQKYGREQVAQIITFGTLQARAVLRDVGRVLEMPYGQVDKLCKLVPNNPANPTTLAEALESETDLIAARRDPDVARLIEIALQLEGLYRHASTHAAGVVIGDRPLDQLVPLYRDPKSDMPVTQFNMKWVEKAGLVKFDFLGLKTLTVVRKAVEYLTQRGENVDIDGLTLDDARTYDMLQRGETVGVFQLESAGMRKALVGMKPDQFEDIIALVALYRPGPMDNIPTYNDRKHGKEEPDYYEDRIADVLRETHGVIIYQEQVMQIAQILSGYSLGEADMLRRAMGKKIASEMEAQRARFNEGAVKGGLTEARSNFIFDVLAKFADYGFNKSHAAAYALISYQTAWLKANYPVEFLAALMTLDMGNTDKLYDYYREGQRADITIVPPSVNTSEVEFSVRDGKIFYALAGIKGVGAQAMAHLVEQRNAAGPFTSLTNFFSRIDTRQINRKALENLIYSGAMDCFGCTREQMFAGLDRLIGHASRVADNSAMGMSDMFGGDTGETEVVLPRVEPMQSADKLLAEFQALGFYMSAHPLDEYEKLLQRLRLRKWSEFERDVKRGQKPRQIAGTVAALQKRRTRSGAMMANLLLSDPSGQFEAAVFSDQLDAHRDLLEVGRSLLVNVSAENEPEGVSLRVNAVQALENVAKQQDHQLYVFVRDAAPLHSIKKRIDGNGQGRVS
ncbi:MAG: DNA polymerase III subunit alpha, partial [Pseudomonadota bacterium]